MSDRTKKRATPRQPRPVNPGQQELMITRRMMEEAIAARVRVEDAARKMQSELQGRLNEAQLIIAGLLLQKKGNRAVLDDKNLEKLSRFAGFDVDRDDETGTVTIELILAEEEEADETPE